MKNPTPMHERPDDVVHLHVSLCQLAAELYQLATTIRFEHDGPTVMRECGLLEFECRRVAGLMEGHREKYGPALKSRLEKFERQRQENRNRQGRVGNGK